MSVLFKEERHRTVSPLSQLILPLPLGNPPVTTAGALSPRALDAVTLNLSSAQCWAGALPVSLYVRSVGVNTTGPSVIPLLLFSILTV